MRLACLGLIFVGHISCDNSGTTFSANTVAIHPAESLGEDALAEQNGAIRPYESSDQDAMEAQVLPPADRSDPSSSPAGTEISSAAMSDESAAGQESSSSSGMPTPEVAGTGSSPPTAEPLDSSPILETAATTVPSSSAATTNTETSTASSALPSEFKVEIFNNGTISATTGSTSKIGESELKGCHDYFNGQGKIVPYTSGGKVNLGPDDILALKVKGNNQEVIVDLAPANVGAYYKVKGICLFLTGNDARAIVSLQGTSLERIWNRALGNGALTSIEIMADSSVGIFEFSTNGNGSQLIVTGAGAYTCPTSFPEISCME
ncbi:hypothetical protein [Oligoflexus tunisiensis]|uniref:hypothetical protein n=1 Tax=Oligoflexus tunisiensis TaxID=708132 RepID=UPI00114C9E12|nr:hypothetical protein [Oligoflexus tunisiensis]